MSNRLAAANMKEYVTIPKTECVAEIVIEKSRFIAAAVGVDSVEEATEFITARRKKYFDATHNCYAFVIGDKAKFSDDGEPQGTAGLPILECIKNSGFDHVCVVVTRYFGGVKLGAGGLVRAYSGSCAQVLRCAAKLQMRVCRQATVVIDYPLLSTVRRALQNVAVEQSVDFADQVTLQFLILSSLSTTITDIVSQNTLGKVKIVFSDDFLAAYDGVQG